MRPETTTLALAPGVLFPTAHTILLIDRAQAGEQFISKQVFDGATVENASQITAVIGAPLKEGTTASGDLLSGHSSSSPPARARARGDVAPNRSGGSASAASARRSLPIPMRRNAVLPSASSRSSDKAAP